MKKSHTALFLLVTVLSQMFSGCAGNETSPETNEKTQNIISSEFAEIDEYIDLLSENKKYDGETFTYVGENYHAPTQEEEIGSIENDSIYYRQRELEEKLGISWTNKVTQSSGEGSEASVMIKQEVMAGGHSFDMTAGTLIVEGQDLLLEGCLVPSERLENIDLDREWWNSSLRNNYMICDKLYFFSGPILPKYYMSSYCIMFDKLLAEQFDLPDLYEEVKSGRWSVDRMLELSSNIPENKDGSGVYRFGNPNGLAFVFGCGMTVTQFDENGIPYVKSSLPIEMSDLSGKIAHIMSDNTLSAHQKRLGSENYETVEQKFGVKSLRDIFGEDKILFYFGNTDDAMKLRETEAEFGIIPMPKSSESQKNYYAYADQWCAYVPKCTRDCEMTGTIIEAAAALSMKHIKPAYYDKILKGQSAYDMPSREMIDLVFDSTVYDMFDIYTGGTINYWGELIHAIDTSIDEDSSSFASSYFVCAKMANRKIKEIIESIGD